MLAVALFLPGMEPKALTAAERKALVRSRLNGFEWRQKAREEKRERQVARDRRRRLARAAAAASSGS